MDDRFECDKTCYEQNCEQFRSLNQVMWQVPVIAMTLTGGLWFGAASVGEMPGFQYLLLLFGVLANLGLIVVLTRVRYVMGQYLEAIKRFNPDSFVAAEGKGFLSPASVATTFRILLFCSAMISIAGMIIVHGSSGRESTSRRVIEVIELDK